MSDQEINKAIAEALGWSQVRSAGHNDDLIGKPPTNAPPTGGTLVRGGWILPDFANDLNAMHEAEKAALRDRSTQIRYMIELPRDHWDEVHATARQRAEAFLKTLGKWRGA